MPTILSLPVTVASLTLHLFYSILFQNGDGKHNMNPAMLDIGAKEKAKGRGLHKTPML